MVFPSKTPIFLSPLRFSLQIIMAMLIVMSIAAGFSASATEITRIHVELPLTIVLRGEIFSVNISITNVTDLCGWELKLYYKNSVLNGTNITEGSFLKSGGDTFFHVAMFTDTYNDTHGCIRALCTLYAPTGVSGDGDLAKISFKAKGFGKTLLDLTDTIIVDSAFPPNEIPHVGIDGLAIVTWLSDFDLDGDVDVDDIRYFVAQYIAYWSGEPFDDRCDFDKDRDIDIDDIRYFVRQYIEYWKTGDP